MTVPAQEERKTCADCKKYKVPNSGCTYAQQIAQGVVLSTDEACSDYVASPKGKAKEPKKTFKDSGVCLDGCYEAIYNNGKPAFLVKKEESFFICEELDFGNGKIIYPKTFLEQFAYEPYCYFKASVPNREDLFWLIRNEFDTFIDVESIWKDVLSACVLLSYQQEKLNTVPYIFLYGDNESGKSTVLKLMKWLCYRPLYGVTIPPADIYGYLEDVDGIGCILEDEVQGIDKDTDKIKIYKSGYQEGTVVPRTLMTQFGRRMLYFRNFCFKVCAGELIPLVKGFNERFLFVPMVEGTPKKEFGDLSKEDKKRLEDLRNMLLKWRILSRDWELPEPQLTMKGRHKELWKPILQITSGLTVYGDLLKYAEEQRKDRLTDRQNTLEGHIVKVIVNYVNALFEAKKRVDGITSILLETIWDALIKELDGTPDAEKTYVMNTPEFDVVTKNKIGYRLREVLSGKSKVTKEEIDGKWVSKRTYDFNLEKMGRIGTKYGYEFSTKLQSFVSSQSVHTIENDGKKPMQTLLEDTKLCNSVEKGVDGSSPSTEEC